MPRRWIAIFSTISLLAIAGCDDDGNLLGHPTPTPENTLAPTSTVAAPTSTPQPANTATAVPPTATNTTAPSLTPTSTFRDATPTPTLAPSATDTPLPEPTATVELPTPSPSATPREPVPLRVGVSAIRITPCGTNPEWDGPITPSGVWGEEFTDTNGNGRWDMGERFVDDPVSSALDSGQNGARFRYNGIFMAGFGSDRIAKGCNDDIWARAVVIEAGVHKVAMVSVDLVGYLRFGRYYGFSKAQALVDPSLGIDTFVYSSTHSHQGPDTLGLWGFQEFSDGKFPHYLAFVDRQVARAISEAARPENMRAATASAATTTPDQSPDLRGLQVRTGCRPPWFFDPELRAVRFVDDSQQTIATVINWSTHPESLEDENELVSSDFVHYIRETVESALGGTVVYFSGDLGAAEIVGDTCVGNADPHADDGSNEFDTRANLGVPRTRQIGELVGGVVVNMLEKAQPLAVDHVDVATANYYAGGTNELFNFGNQVGILDLDPAQFDPTKCGPNTQICAPIEQHVLSLEDSEGQPLLQMVTAPGELFPELFYGVEEHGRSDCPAAHTGAPYEPSIRNAMIAPHRWLIGLSPDQLGYIVPSYDFYAPPALGSESSDVCRGQSYDPNYPGRRVPEHYHESLSIGTASAVGTTCYALQLLGRQDLLQQNAACLQLFGLGN